jgi:HprK-related kinase A
VKVGELPLGGLRSRLRQGDLLLSFGPVQARVISGDVSFGIALHRLYSRWDAVSSASAVADLTLCLRRTGLGRWTWFVDGRPSPRTFGRGMALAHFEWTMHLAMAGALAPHVSVHAAVVVRPDGRAVALVGRSGSGKSTLAAGLVAAGWSLAADEFLVLDPAGSIIPVPAVITLKGDSIDLIRARLPGAVFGPLAVDPDRGPISHFAAPRVVTDGKSLDLRAILFPRYVQGAEPLVRSIPRGEAIIRLGQQSHNLHLVGPEGLGLVAGLARRPVHAIRYASLDAGMQLVNELVDQP